MATLSITRAWNEAAEFVRRESRLVLPIAFMLSAFPVALMQALTPAPPVPGQLPEAGLWLALFPVALLASMVANVAISLLALRGGTAVGEALARGVARLPVVLGAFLLLVLAGLVAIFVVAMMVVALVPGAVSPTGTPTPETAVAVLLVIFVLLPAMLYFGARLALISPLAATEQAGPIGLIRRSWKLTRGHAWRLAAFLLLAGLSVGIVSAAVESVVGILIALAVGPPHPGSLGALLVIIVMAGVSTVLTAYLASMIARIYAQLSDEAVPSVFA